MKNELKAFEETHHKQVKIEVYWFLVIKRTQQIQFERSHLKIIWDSKNLLNLQNRTAFIKA